MFPKASISTPSYCGISRPIVASIMSAPELCYVPLGWTGTMLSSSKTLTDTVILCTEEFPRVKEQLRSGQMTVPGDQWPIFLYAGSVYDPNNPWAGLLRSGILVYVCVAPKLDHYSIDSPLGIQIHFHLPQFSRQGAASYEVRQRSDPWYDKSHTSIYRIRRNSGI